MISEKALVRAFPISSRVRTRTRWSKKGTVTGYVYRDGVPHLRVLFDGRRTVKRVQYSEIERVDQ